MDKYLEKKIRVLKSKLSLNQPLNKCSSHESINPKRTLVKQQRFIAFIKGVLKLLVVLIELYQKTFL